MESQEGKNSNLSDASSAKYNIQVGPALWASCAKNRFFFPVPKQLGRNRVLPGNHGFFSFRHWLLVEPLEWNEIRISVDLSSPLTRNRLFFCRILLPNGIIVRFIPRSSKKTYSSYSSFSFRIGSSLVLLSLMISPFSSSCSSREGLSFLLLALAFHSQRVSLFYKAEQSAWRWSEESSINTQEHDAGHSINESADHFIKHICLTFLDAFFLGDSPTDPAVIDDRMVQRNQSHWIW